MKPCSFPGCEKPVSCKGLCNGHYEQQRTGKPLRPLRLYFSSLTPYERVMARAEPQGECLVYIGATVSGYGYVGIANKRTALAHRIVMEHHHGPSDLDVLHSCNNPPCVLIDHLRYGTVQENIQDAINSGHMTPRRFLTDDEVRAIRADTRTQASIAAEYGCGQSTIHNIKAGKRRGDVQ